MLKLETSAEDSFWQEKMIRHINECTSLEELKEISRLLTKIATTRQTAVKWLVHENLDLMAGELNKTFNEWEEKLNRPNPYPGN